MLLARPAKSWASETGKGWEAEADAPSSIQPLSVRVCERQERTRQVPGTTGIGKKGLWWKHPVVGEPERTRAAAMFYRDPLLVSTDTVVVNMIMALDTPKLAPPVVSEY